MTTYTAINDSEIAVGQPITNDLMTRLRDNTLAIQEGDASAPKIANSAFNDGTITPAKLSEPTALVAIDSASPSAVASVDLTCDTTSYEVHELHGRTIIPASDNVDCWIRVGDGSIYSTATDYTNIFDYYDILNGTDNETASRETAGQINLTAGATDAGVGTATTPEYEFINFVFRIFTPNANRVPFWDAHSWWVAANGQRNYQRLQGYFTNVTEPEITVTTLRVLFSSGNIESGGLTLYGYNLS